MAKERWQNEDVVLHNPFGVLSGLRTARQTEEPKNTPEEPVSAREIVMPKVRSARLDKAHRSGKIVTVVSFHGEPTDEAKKIWLKRMKKELGVGGAIEEGQVVLQGDQRERLKGNGK